MPSLVGVGHLSSSTRCSRRCVPTSSVCAHRAKRRRLTRPAPPPADPARLQGHVRGRSMGRAARAPPSCHRAAPARAVRRLSDPHPRASPDRPSSPSSPRRYISLAPSSFSSFDLTLLSCFPGSSSTPTCRSLPHLASPQPLLLFCVLLSTTPLSLGPADLAYPSHILVPLYQPAALLPRRCRRRRLGRGARARRGVSLGPSSPPCLDSSRP